MGFERRLTQIKWGLLLVMLAVPLRLAWITLWQAPDLNLHPYNPRLQENLALRGNLRDRNGRILAISSPSGRLYPQENLSAHWTGFYSRNLGLAGVEDWKNALLRERRFGSGEALPGHSLKLSLDLTWQRKLQLALAGHRGAAILLDLESGQILGACSQPSFDPNRVESQWKAWQSDPGSPLLNRPFLGLYPAGELWPAWRDRLLELQRRPPTLMDWTPPLKVKDQWLISPALLAVAAFRTGSNLPVSQIFSDYRQPWSPQPLPWPLESYNWCSAVEWNGQKVSWVLVYRSPHLLVQVWEDSLEQQQALMQACKAFQAP